MSSWKVDLPNPEIRVMEIATSPAQGTKLFRWALYAEHGANRDMEPVFGGYQDYSRGDVEGFLTWFAPLMGLDTWTYI